MRVYIFWWILEFFFGGCQIIFFLVKSRILSLELDFDLDLALVNPRNFWLCQVVQSRFSMSLFRSLINFGRSTIDHSWSWGFYGSLQLISLTALTNQMTSFPNQFINAMLMACRPNRTPQSSFSDFALESDTVQLVKIEKKTGKSPMLVIVFFSEEDYVIEIKILLVWNVKLSII